MGDVNDDEIVRALMRLDVTRGVAPIFFLQTGAPDITDTVKLQGDQHDADPDPKWTPPTPECRNARPDSYHQRGRHEDQHLWHEEWITRRENHNDCEWHKVICRCDQTSEI